MHLDYVQHLDKTKLKEEQYLALLQLKIFLSVELHHHFYQNEHGCLQLIFDNFLVTTQSIRKRVAGSQRDFAYEACRFPKRNG